MSVPATARFRIGRMLPLPNSHQLFAGGLGGTVGPIAIEVEGAFSRFDRNTFSTADDGDNLGEAGPRDFEARR